MCFWCKDKKAKEIISRMLQDIQFGISALENDELEIKGGTYKQGMITGYRNAEAALTKQLGKL